MPDQYTLEGFYQPTSQACVVDLLPPTFAGITGLTAQSNGSLLASWAAGSDVSLPIVYDVFIQAATATGLFNVANRALSTFSLSRAIFSLADGSLLQQGVTYFVGVRARDAVGNVDANLVSLSAVSLGVPESSILAAIAAVPASVWAAIRAANNSPGSFGEALDVPVSSRLATAGYTAPNNAGIAAIQAKTDNLPADPAAQSDVTSAEANILAQVADVSGAVWDELLVDHDAPGTFGGNAQTPAINPTQVADAVWDALLVDHDDPGTFGNQAQSQQSLDPAQVAAAVWDAELIDYDTPGTFGANLQNPPLTAAQTASAVLDVPIGAHNTPNTVGGAIANAGSGGALAKEALTGVLVGEGLVGAVTDAGGSDALVGLLVD